MLRHILLSASCVLLAASPSFADADTEEFVRANANSVLESLNDPGLDAAERRVAFQQYMDEFANIDAVARFVIGKYSRRFDEAEMERYLVAFRTYALAVYEFYFNEYKGQNVEVTGSTDRNPRDSIVDTQILRGDGRSAEGGGAALPARHPRDDRRCRLTGCGECLHPCPALWRGTRARLSFAPCLDCDQYRDGLGCDRMGDKPLILR